MKIYKTKMTGESKLPELQKFFIERKMIRLNSNIYLTTKIATIASASIVQSSWKLK